MSVKKHLEDLEVFRATNNEPGIANACFKIGDIYLKKKKWSEAKEYLREAKAICGKLGNEEGFALTSVGLGDVYRHSQNLETARLHYKQALEYFGKQDDEKIIANVMERLGELSKEQGDLQEALEAFSKARDICQTYNDQLGVAHFNERMGLVYRQDDQLSQAIEGFQKAMVYYDQNQIADRLAFVLTGLGEAHYKMGKPQEALKCLTQALNIYQKLGARKLAELVAAEVAAIEETLVDEKQASP